ncbi:hypothetical protein [Pseudoramibacter alactolyticus]|uniref:hypothetical protein n=1 Tax=Pseudoramibacter alactolyticus TaxID=113287 RepID=UPI0028E3A708|nr:hypothetical protein [Pseudoramibacter alactolyticus]
MIKKKRSPAKIIFFCILGILILVVAVSVFSKNGDTLDQDLIVIKDNVNFNGDKIGECAYINVTDDFFKTIKAKDIKWFADHKVKGQEKKYDYIYIVDNSGDAILFPGSLIYTAYQGKIDDSDHPKDGAMKSIIGTWERKNGKYHYTKGKN